MDSLNSSQSDIDFSPTESADSVISFNEASQQLRAEPYLLRQWSRRFAPFLSSSVNSETPRYINSDIITLSIIQTLIVQGYTDEQITKHLTVRTPGAVSVDAPASQPGTFGTPSGNRQPETGPYMRPTQEDESAAQRHPQHGHPLSSPGLDPRPDGNEVSPPENSESALAQFSVADFPQPLADVFDVLAANQRSVLNSQTTVREIAGVLVQDNFNLKDENSKLRDRMLELERVLAEYQRREELRKERLESRLRALEGTVGGLQQQIAQIVQAIRKRRRGFFG